MVAIVRSPHCRGAFVVMTEAGGSPAIPDTFTVPSTYAPPPLQLPEMGAGTLAWGDPNQGWGLNYNTTDVTAAFEVLMDGGVSLFDTSEVYGYHGFKIGEGAEQLVGSLASRQPDPPLVSTTFMPVPWANILSGGGLRIGRRAVVDAVRNSIARLGVGSVDIYALHAPLPYLGGRTALYEGLAEAYSLGLCRGVGVCNFNAAQLREAHMAFRRLGVPLVSNQARPVVCTVGTVRTCVTFVTTRMRPV